MFSSFNNSIAQFAVNQYLGYSYLSIPKPTTVQSQGEWVFIPFIAPSIKEVEGLKASPLVSSDIICGDCGRKQTIHPFISEHPFEDNCYRDPFSEWGFPFNERNGIRNSDYFLSTGLPYIPNELSGSASLELETEEFDTSAAADTEHYKLDKWHDKALDENNNFYCTLTLEQHQSKNGTVTEAVTRYDKSSRSFSYAPADHTIGSLTPEITNAYVESTSGFIARQIIDPILTDKYQRRLLNAFINKKGQLQVGSIVIVTSPTGKVTATCVNSKCYTKNATGDYERRSIELNGIDYSLALPMQVPTRNMMERQIYSIIQHGNEHAAKWYLEKGDLTNAEECETCKGKHDTYYHLSWELSDPTSPSESELDSWTDVDKISFLFDHYRFCNEPTCKCNDWLTKYGFGPTKENAA